MAEPPMPDLSHLSAEEREIIEQVFKRQRAEEEKEVQISQKADQELEGIEKQINERKENARKLVGTQDDAICQICQKTKFADGIGHKCFYCQLRSCARCGGRTQSKNKAIWACSLCQKRQQILMKTGKWFQPEDQKGCISPSPSTSAVDGQTPPPFDEMQQDVPYQPQEMPPAQSMAKPPNGGPPPQMQPAAQQRQQPTQQQTLQRQQQPIAQQQPTGHQRQAAPVQQRGLEQRPGSTPTDPRTIPPDGTMNRQPSQDTRQHDTRRTSQSGPQPYQQRGPGPATSSTTRTSDQGRLKNQASMDREKERQREEEKRREEDRRRKEDRQRNEENQRPVFYTDTGEEWTKAENKERMATLPEDQSEHQSSPSPRRNARERRDQISAREHHRDISSSERRRHPDLVDRSYEATRDSSEREDYDDRRRRDQRRDKSPSNGQMNDMSSGQLFGSVSNAGMSTGGTANRAEFRRNRSVTRTEDDALRRPSQSGKPKEVEPVPREGSIHRHKKNKLHRQLRSMSSSEEEMPSTSDGFSGEEAVQRVPNECTSEKDLLRYIYGPDKLKNGRKSPLGMKRDDRSSPVSKSNVIPGDILAAKIRTYLSHPVTWQPSADQRRLIGHMLLHRTDCASNGDLGLKVVGGRRTDTGRLGAFITRVRTGSVADTIGRLRPGDEVLEWNGENLQNATFDQVYEIIAASKNDSQVELIVSRSTSIPGGDDFLNVQQRTWTGAAAGQQTASALAPYLGTSQQRVLPNPHLVAAQEDLLMRSPSTSPLLTTQIPHSQSAILPHLHMLQQTSPRRTHPSVYYQTTGSMPTMVAPEMQFAKGQIFGRIELSLFYSLHERLLTVTLVRAMDLPPRPDGMPRNPYVKIFLLPDRSEASRRQSAVLAETLMPVWNENFCYKQLTEPVLMERVLEVTVWDYDKYETNSFLGETLIEFSTVPLDGQPLKYTLVDMDEENPLRARLRMRRMSPYSSGLPQRPRSEMGYGGYGPRSQVEYGYEYTYDGAPGPRQQLLDPVGMRRSRTYDRAGITGRGAPIRDYNREVRPEDDWTFNNQSGYLSDHGYTQPVPMQRYRHRRPRSATAMRPMTAAEMSASRMYSRNLPSEPYYEQDVEPMPPQQFQMQGQQPMQQMQQMPQGYQQQQMMPMQQGMMPHQRYNDPRSPNGRVVMEAMQEAMGYGSDGSETTSVHSAHSMPTVRTINRRRPPQEIESEERQHEDYQEHVPSMRGGNNSQQESNKQLQQAKERKKSLMTRLIPGRNPQMDGKRTGFARSEEVGIPENLSSDRLQTAPFLKQTSKESTDSGHSDNWLPVLPDGPLGTFVDNLGPGQVVGRQVLASPVLGEIQIGIVAGRAGIDVEIIRAKNLVVKPGTKINPAPYVKVYLMEGKQCIAKAKTNPVRKTTAPLFQQHLIFNDTPKKKMLQITVLGDYGRMERKSFMGIAQIRLDDLDLGSEPIIGWYKLYHSSSLAGTGPIRKDSETSLTGAQ